MTTFTDFLHGHAIAYTDMAGRKIMAEAYLLDAERYKICLFDFNSLKLLKTYNTTEKNTIIFFNNHCNGTEKNVVLPFPAPQGSNSGNFNQPQ